MPTMNQNSFPQEPVLIDGFYPAKLLRVEEYEKTYDGQVTPKLAWIFGINASDDAIDPDVEYETEREGLFEIGAYTSFATGENSNFHKLGFPAFVPEDWDGNTDSLIGMACTARVTSYEKDERVRNVIDKITKPKKGQKAKVTTPPEEDDFDDLPF